MRDRRRWGVTLGVVIGAAGVACLCLGGALSASASTGPQSPGAVIAGAVSETALPTGVLQASDTPFAITLPSGAACNYSTANTGAGGQDFVDTYVLDNATDPNPGALTYPSGNPSDSASPGPLLLNDISTPGFGAVYTGQGTTSTGGIPSPLPAFNWNNYVYTPTKATSSEPAGIYAGTFNVGVLCGNGGLGNPEKWWNTQVEFVTDTSDPNGFQWEVVAATGPPPSTTTAPAGATTTTTLPGGTITPVSVGTATTVPGGTTTTVPGSTQGGTTPTVGIGATGSGSGSSGSGSSGSGSSSDGSGATTDSPDASSALAATGTNVRLLINVGIILIVAGVATLLFVPRPRKARRSRL